MPAILLYFLIVIEIGLGLFVIIQKPTSIINRSFLAICISFAIWSLAIGILISPIILDEQIMRNIANVMFLSGLMITTSFLIFSWVFPQKVNKINFYQIVWLVLPCLIVAFLLFFTDLFVKAVHPGKEVAEKIEFDIRGYCVYPMFFIGNIFWASWTLIKRYLISSGINKQQIIYLFVGLGIFLGLGSVLDVVLPMLGNSDFVIFSPLYPIAFLVTTSYSILRYRLLDIEVVIKRTSLYLILVAIITGLYTFILMLPHKFIGPPGSPGSVGLMIAAAIVIAITVQPLRDWLDAVTDRLFFQKKYDYYRVLEKITHELNSVINLPDALNVVARPLIDEMHLKSAGFYLREKTAEAAYVCRKKAGPNAETLPDYVEEENPAVNYLMENKEILEAGKFRHKFGHLYSGDKILDPQKAGIQKALDTTFQAGLLVPLILKQNLMGFAVLGEKRSGDQFTQRDLALLELMAGQMAITLENIKMYEQMLNNERLTIIGTMSAGIAHEIRNPLASINAFIQMLPMKYDKPKFRKRFDEIIPAEIERISGITENLLAFSKPSPLKLEQVFIRNVIDRVIMLLSNQLHKSQIEVVKILDNIPVIQADTQQITQVFLNLLLNAIQASNPGGKITIAAGTRSQGLNTLDRSGSHILVSVLDEGEGIKKTNLANVFQPFFTTKNEGTGLGLATSKRIIEAHHGKITVESKEGLGARFIVRLPLHLTLNEV